MSEPVLGAVLVLTILVLVRTAVGYARYRAVYRYDEDDLDDARRDSAKRSRATIAGRSSEQLAPLFADFAERWDPADARFLGAPVDYVVFDGLSRGSLERVVLVEVKTGGGRLNASERQVRAAIEQGRVGYELVRLG